MTFTLADLAAIANAQFWQVTVVCVLVALVTRLGCRHRPHLAYLLWMLVVVKAVTPPLVASPTGLFSWVNANRIESDVPAPAPAVATARVEQPARTPPRTTFGTRRVPRVQSEAPRPATPAAAPPAPAPSHAARIAPPAPEKHQYSLSPAQIGLALWGAGCFALSAAVAVKWWRLRRRWGSQAVPADPELTRQVDDLARELGLRRAVRLLVSSAAVMPAVFGARRSTILLPAALVKEMTRDLLRPILAHELIHVRRRDPAAAVLQLAAQLLWWFHPLVWWANREARREREQACDEEVIASLGCRATEYARALLAVIESQPRREQLFPLPSIGMFGVTARRLEHIVRQSGGFHRRTPRAYYAIALLALALLLPGAGLKVGAQTPAAGDTETAAGPQAAEGPKAAARKAPTAILDPAAKSAGEKALAQLIELGANVSDKMGEDRVREIWISFGESWGGGVRELSLLDNVVTLGRVSLSTSLADITRPARISRPDGAKGLSDLKLRAPLETLDLEYVSDEDFMEVRKLPACRKLVLTAMQLTPAGCRHLAAIAGGIESIGFQASEFPESSSRGITDDQLAELGGLRDLKSLSISDSPITAAGLKHLEGMKSLNHLSLLRCPELEKSDLEPIPRLGSLRELELDGLVSAAGLANVSRHDALEKLTLAISDLKPAEVETLAHLSHLEQLSIQTHRGQSARAPLSQADRLKQVPLGNAIAHAVAGLPSLQTLALEITIDNQGLAALAAAPKLQSERLELPEVDDQSLEFAGRLAGLKQLHLHGPGKLSDRGLARVQPLERLVELSLPGAGLTDAGLAHLAGLAALKQLDLSGSKISGAGLAALDRCQELTSLNLAGSSVDDAGCRLLPQFKRLEQLDLSRSKITDVGLESIALLPDLTHLTIDGATAVSDFGLERLARLKRLESVSAFGTAVSRQGIATLRRELPQIRVTWSNRNVDSRTYVAPTFQPLPDAAAGIGNPAGAPKEDGAAPTAAASDKALAQVREFGLNPSEWTPAGFSKQSTLREIYVELGIACPGDDWELAALGKAENTGELNLAIDFRLVSPQALSGLKLARPLSSLHLIHATDKTFDELNRIPPSGRLVLLDWKLTAAGCRRLAALVPGVESLDIFASGPAKAPRGASDAELAELGVLKNLKSLRLSSPSVTGAGLKPLSGMKNLNSLYLRDCPALEKSDLAPLAGASALRQLELTFPVSAAGVKNIARLDSVETLTLKVSDLAPADVEPLARMPHVQTLSVESNQTFDDPADRSLDLRPEKMPLGNAVGRAAGRMPGLRIVSVELPMDNSGLEGLAAAGNLQAVRLTLADVDNQSLKLVSRLLHLRQLRLAGPGKLSDEGLAHLARLTRLVDLSLPGAGLTDVGLTHLADLVSIEALDLSRSKITGSGLAALARWKSLKTLILFGSAVDDDACRLLPQFARLEQLDLSHSKISDVGLESIAKLTALAELSLDGTAVTDAGLASLEPLKNLHTVYAIGTMIGEKHSFDDEPSAEPQRRFKVVADTAMTSTADGVMLMSKDPSTGAEIGYHIAGFDDEEREDLEEMSDEGPAADEREPAAEAPSKGANAASPEAVVGEKAIERLRKLGGLAADTFNGAEQAYIFYIELGKAWKGGEADFALIDDVARFKPVNLRIDFRYTSPQTVSQLKFERPLETLFLMNETDESLEKATSLPTCRRLKFVQSRLSPAGFRRAAALAPNVETLALYGAWPSGEKGGITDAGLAAFSGLLNLKQLQINDSPITAAGLKPIWGMKHLEHLELDNCWTLGTLDLEEIAALESMRTLNLGQVSAAGLANICTLHALEKLKCMIGDIKPEDVAPLENLTHMQDLDIWQMLPEAERGVDRLKDLRPVRVPLGNAIASAAGKMPGLRSLDLSSTTMSDKGLESLGTLQKLQSVKLDLIEVDDQTLALLGRMSALQELMIEGGPVKISDQGFAHLAHLTQLRSLVLPSAAGITDAGLAHLAGLTELESLYLPKANVTGSGLAALVRLTKLESIMLEGSPFDDAGCRFLPQFPHLESLYLTDSKITDVGLESIGKLTRLYNLGIDGATAVTDAGLAHLKRLKQLQSLSAADTGITRNGINTLRKSVRGVQVNLSPRHRPER